MIDVSDGIASDVERICERSGVPLEVQLADLPLEEGVAGGRARPRARPARARGRGGRGLRAAVHRAGAARATTVERAADDAGSRVTWIGRVSAAAADGEAAVRLLDEAGRPRRLRGWDHLRGGRERKVPSWTSFTIIAVATRSRIDRVAVAVDLRSSASVCFCLVVLLSVPHSLTIGGHLSTVGARHCGIRLASTS